MREAFQNRMQKCGEIDFGNRWWEGECPIMHWDAMPWKEVVVRERGRGKARE